MEKISQIKQKIVKIQESVANITAASETFNVASEGLVAANAEISKCKEETLAQVALMAEAKAAFDAEKLAFETKEGDNAAAQKVIQEGFEKTIAAQAAEIAKLNETLVANIETVQQITNETNDKVNEVKTNGEEIGAALVDLEGDIDGLQKGVEETENKVNANNAVETPAVESPTSVEDAVEMPAVSPVATPAAPAAPAVSPAAPVSPAAATTESKAIQRSALITKLKNKIFDKTTPGSKSDKTSNAATQLMNWDREHKFKKTKNAWSNNNKAEYIKVFSTTFGGSKKRTTRKKRKNRKTNKRKN
jgi:hypothetical protein